MRLRPALRALAIMISTAALVLGASAPGLAAGAERKTYRAAMTASGGVSGSFSGLELVDYLSGQYQDRLIGSAPRSSAFTVGGKPCANGSVRLNGHATLDWANQPDGWQWGNFQVTCKHPDGTTHRYWWGIQHNGSWQFTSTDCLSVTRKTDAAAGTTSYHVTTRYATNPDVHCQAQDELLDNAYNTKTSTPRDIHFTASFTVSGVVPTIT